MNDVSVSYTEVIIPTSRKERAKENNQQADKTEQRTKAASLQVRYIMWCLNPTNISQIKVVAIAKCIINEHD